MSLPWHRYTVVLRYSDDDERTISLSAQNAREARSWALDFAKDSLDDPRWGGDRSKGMPKVVRVSREY